jgi:hypothetical protein
MARFDDDISDGARGMRGEITRPKAGDAFRLAALLEAVPSPVLAS